ncbi:AraC-like DNA-binding protein [Leeuwenhoekiella aestuarii]|uniref:AraC-like DNA-binding protein n=1 Tax=Leeuwenhoekiella aestuarii TaxID=2249426 RepID=A0A4Q0NZE5_9FLAO|nr:helix-turn-helix transcriptional regulator [Leeuwenhoekiella aestuarii]RXG16028.1 AraC-like DNA-binding protein [Leeuwenhoekiella aestuarii]RXG16722.1 AraC-like DNA-binding protein [Leeuwenhoekiella aestuarii]
MQKIPILKLETFDNSFTDSNFYANDFAKHIVTNSKLVHKPHTHNFYLCVLFTEGMGTHEIDFTTYPIQAGSVFFLSPGQTHFWQFETQPQGYFFFHTLEVFEITLSKQRLENFPFYYSVNNSPTLTLTPFQLKDITKRFEEIYTEYSTKKLYKTEKLTNLINLIYIDLSRLYIPEEHVFESSISATYFTILKSFEKLLDLQFRSEKSASFYAEQLNITTKHLNRIIKTILDKTTTDLIHERTLLEAKRLIVHTENSLNEISEILGFEDYAYFSRIFKAKTNQSPKAFKNQYAH